MESKYPEELVIINKNISNYMNKLYRDNNICINTIGNINENEINEMYKNTLIQNINLLEQLKNNLFQKINDINSKINNYANNINTIKNININNKYIHKINFNTKLSNINIKSYNLPPPKKYINHKISKNVFCEFENINNLDELSPCIKFLSNSKNKNIPNGLYLCLYKNVYIKLKLGLYSNNIQQSKIYLCSNKYKNECNKNKCLDIHYGDKIKKPEYNRKIINNKFFGNPYTLSKDLNTINIDSIKILIAYLSTEILALYSWYDKYKKNNDFIKIIISDPLILKKN